MLRRFIERPVLSTVISIILLLLGLISMTSLPITQFPDIAPPTVSVNAFYPGANAEVVARAVATPLEEAINGVENMTYMTSNSGNDGSMSINVFLNREPIRTWRLSMYRIGYPRPLVRFRLKWCRREYPRRSSRTV